MALNNPASLYSGGNVRLDSTPYLRFALQERARKEARGYAIDQYYQKLPENINDKGVRNQEVPIIADIKNKMSETWMQNRDALKRGDPTAQMKMQQLYRQAQGITRESQNASKIDMQLGSMALNKDNQGILNNEDFIQQHAIHNLPVNDPEYKPFDISQAMANRPFDPIAYAKNLKSNVKYSEGIPTITQHPQDKNLEVVTTNPILDDATKQNLYAGAVYKLHNDIAFEKSLQKNFSTPEQIAPLNEVSKRVFGHEIQAPEDIAAAYTASLLPSQSTRAHTINSIDAQNSEWNRRNAITDAQRRKAAALRNSQSNARLDRMMSGANDVGYPLDAVVNDAVTNHEIKSAEGASMGTQERIYRKDVPVGEMEMYNPKDTRVRGYKDLETGDEYYLPTKDANGHFQLVGEGGKIIGADFARQNVINKGVPTNKAKQGMYFNKEGKKKFNVINPRTGAVVMEGVDEETAKKATAKGYKTQ